MQLNARKILIGLPIAGALGCILFPFAIYFIGLAIAPPPPVPAQAPVPPMIAEAIWARADGGRATALTPITHVSMAQFAACVAIEDFLDTTPGDARRVAACQRYMPAVQGVEYLSRVHMRGANLQSPFREGLGRFSTTVWLTHSWTKAEFLSTLAERGEFGFGFRGADAAASGYFGRAAVQLTLPQAAMIGAFIGARPVDPWCDPATAAGMRRRVLERMRDNLAIDDAALEAANVTELGLAPPPADHKPCPD